MDLICFISNAFVDLLSDVANNVCMHNGKKNIIPEHLFRALQELNIDEFLPFLLSDDQSKTLPEILRIERKKQDGLHATVEQASNPKHRAHMLNGMLKRLSKFNENSIDTVKENKKKKRNKNKLWMQGKTPEEMQEIQRKLLENVGMSDSEGVQEATSNDNESPSHHMGSSNDNTTPMQTSNTV